MKKLLLIIIIFNTPLWGSNKSNVSEKPMEIPKDLRWLKDYDKNRSNYDIPQRPDKVPEAAKWFAKHNRWAHLDRRKNIYYQWYTNGTLETKGTLKNQKPEGEFVFWSWDRKKMMVQFFENGKIIKKINYKIYFPDSQRPSNIPGKSIWAKKNNEWVFYDKKNNYLYSWYMNGEKRLKYKMMNNKFHGKFFIWYKNGNVKAKGNFLNHFSEGMHSMYDENGKLVEEQFYKHDVLIYTNDYRRKPPANFPKGTSWNKQFKGWKYKKGSKFFIIYSSGKVKCEIDANGLEFHGKYRKWLRNGNLFMEGEYKNSLKEGKWIVYDKTGKIPRYEAYYKKNKIVKSKKY